MSQSMLALMLTTADNPFSPFDQPDDWYAFDERHGYHTTALLARLIITSIELSEFDQQLDLNRAVEDVMRLNGFGLYIKVEKVIQV